MPVPGDIVEPNYVVPEPAAGQPNPQQQMHYVNNQGVGRMLPDLDVNEQCSSVPLDTLSDDKKDKKQIDVTDMKRPSVNDSVNVISDYLCRYAVGAENNFERKAIESLVKKLKDRRKDLEDFITCISNMGAQRSKCVTITRTLDGRLQVAGRKGFPHVVYAKVFRWSDLHKNELRHENYCTNAFDQKTEFVCINPYHYNRVIVTGEENVGQAPNTPQNYQDPRAAGTYHYAPNFPAPRPPQPQPPQGYYNGYYQGQANVSAHPGTVPNAVMNRPMMRPRAPQPYQSAQMPAPQMYPPGYPRYQVPPTHPGHPGQQYYPSSYNYQQQQHQRPAMSHVQQPQQQQPSQAQPQMRYPAPTQTPMVEQQQQQQTQQSHNQYKATLEEIGKIEQQAPILTALVKDGSDDESFAAKKAAVEKQTSSSMSTPSVQYSQHSQQQFFPPSTSSDEHYQQQQQRQQQQQQQQQSVASYQQQVQGGYVQAASAGSNFQGQTAQGVQYQMPGSYPVHYPMTQPNRMLNSEWEESGELGQTGYKVDSSTSSTSVASTPAASTPYQAGMYAPGYNMHPSERLSRPTTAFQDGSQQQQQQAQSTQQQQQFFYAQRGPGFNGQPPRMIAPDQPTYSQPAQDPYYQGSSQSVYFQRSEQRMEPNANPYQQYSNYYDCAQQVVPQESDAASDKPDDTLAYQKDTKMEAPASVVTDRKSERRSLDDPASMDLAPPASGWSASDMSLMDVDTMSLLGQRSLRSTASAMDHEDLIDAETPLADLNDNGLLEDAADVDAQQMDRYMFDKNPPMSTETLVFDDDISLSSVNPPTSVNNGNYGLEQNQGNVHTTAAGPSLIQNNEPPRKVFVATIPDLDDEEVQSNARKAVIERLATTKQTDRTVSHEMVEYAVIQSNGLTPEESETFFKDFNKAKKRDSFFILSQDKVPNEINYQKLIDENPGSRCIDGDSQGQFEEPLTREQLEVMFAPSDPVFRHDTAQSGDGGVKSPRVKALLSCIPFVIGRVYRVPHPPLTPAQVDCERDRRRLMQWDRRFVEVFGTMEEKMTYTRLEDRKPVVKRDASREQPPTGQHHVTADVKSLPPIPSNRGFNLRFHRPELPPRPRFVPPSLGTPLIRPTMTHIPAHYSPNQVVVNGSVTNMEQSTSDLTSSIFRPASMISHSQTAKPPALRPAPRLTNNSNTFTDAQNDLLRNDLQTGALLNQRMRNERQGGMRSAMDPIPPVRVPTVEPPCDFPFARDSRPAAIRPALQNALRDQNGNVINPAGLDIVRATPEEVFIAHHNMMLKIGRPDYIAGYDEYQKTEVGVKLCEQVEPPFWCTIDYYEENALVGEKYQAPQEFREIQIDGGVNPLLKDRFCLGSVTNMARTEVTRRVLKSMESGVILRLKNEGDVWLTICSPHPVFVQSFHLDVQGMRCVSDEPHRFESGTTVKIFDLQQTRDEIASRNYFRNYWDKIRRGKLQLDSLTNEIDRMKLEATVDTSIDELRRLCTIRLSFVKGFGMAYDRAAITECPCWIEIRVSRALQILDDLLRREGN